MFSILYVQDNHVYQIGPFHTKDEAVTRGKRKDSSCDGHDPETEFNLNDDRVYLQEDGKRIVEIMGWGELETL